MIDSINPCISLKRILLETIYFYLKNISLLEIVLCECYLLKYEFIYYLIFLTSLFFFFLQLLMIRKVMEKCIGHKV